MLIGFIVTAIATSASDVIVPILIGVGAGSLINYATQEPSDTTSTLPQPLKDEATLLKKKADTAKALLTTGITDQTQAILDTQKELHATQVHLEEQGALFAVATHQTTHLVAASNQVIEATISEFDALKIELSRIKQELQRSQRELAHANETLVTLAEKTAHEHATFTGLLSNATEEITQITETMRRANGVLAATHAAEIKTLTKKIDELEPAVKSLTTKLDASTQENKRQSKEIEQLLATNKRYIEAIKALSETEAPSTRAPAHSLRLFH